MTGNKTVILLIINARNWSGVNMGKEHNDRREVGWIREDEIKSQQKLKIQTCTEKMQKETY